MTSDHNLPPGCDNADISRAANERYEDVDADDLDHACRTCGMPCDCARSPCDECSGCDEDDEPILEDDEE